MFLLGSDDLPTEAKVAPTRDLNDALRAEWAGFEIGERIPLAEIARAHVTATAPHRITRLPQPKGNFRLGTRLLPFRMSTSPPPSLEFSLGDRTLNSGFVLVTVGRAVYASGVDRNTSN